MIKTPRMHPALLLLLIFQIVVAPIYGETLDTQPQSGASTTTPAPFVNLDSEVPNSDGKRILGNYPGAVLMPIYLWGAVTQTGIIYVPKRTDLVTLLFLVGGPKTNAKLDSTKIKRISAEKQSIIKVNLENLLSEVDIEPPILEANDIISIPEKPPLIDPDVMATVTFVTSIMGIILFSISFSDKVF